MLPEISLLRNESSTLLEEGQRNPAAPRAHVRPTACGRKKGKKPLSPQERDRHRSWPCYRLQVPSKEMKAQSLWPCLLVTPLPPPWPVGAAPALLEKECHPFLSRPPYNLFRMQIRYPAPDPTEDQIGSPLASHAGVWRLLQSKSGSFFFFFKPALTGVLSLPLWKCTFTVTL